MNWTLEGSHSVISNPPRVDLVVAGDVQNLRISADFDFFEVHIGVEWHVTAGVAQRARSGCAILRVATPGTDASVLTSSADKRGRRMR